MASRGLIVASVLMVVLGYTLYTPLPEGIAEPWKLRIILANLKMLHAFTYVGEKIGVDSRVNLTRKGFNLMFSFGSRDSRVEAQDYSFDGVKVRIYRPKGEENTVLPGLVYYHGGGWVYMNVDCYDSLTSYIAAEANIAVVSVEYNVSKFILITKLLQSDLVLVDGLQGMLLQGIPSHSYRLAPEHPFPIPFDDCVIATVHLLRNAKNYKIDAHRIGIAGDSAGGNLAAAVALKLRDDKLELQPKIQCLLYPVLQSIDLHSPSRVRNSPMSGMLSSHGVLISGYLRIPTKYAPVIHQNRHLSADLRQRYSKYLDYSQLPASFIPNSYKPNPAPSSGEPGQIPEAAQKLFVHSYVAPLLSPDLSGLPPAYVFTVGADTLRDDGALYVKRLKDAGVKAKLVDYPESFHGVLSVGIKFDARDEGRRDFLDFVKENL